MDRRRELKRQYKMTRPDMGLFIVRCNNNSKVLVQATPDLRTVQTGILIRLGSNMHPNRELQKEWNEFGEQAFSMEVLETLAYDEDASKTDYKEDLKLLQSMWEEELIKEGKQLYKKKPIQMTGKNGDGNAIPVFSYVIQAVEFGNSAFIVMGC